VKSEFRTESLGGCGLNDVLTWISRRTEENAGMAKRPDTARNEGQW
jgi:hypothetical protein